MDIFDTRLRELLVQIENKCKENKSKIDCIVPISGGKDGTFMLWFLRRYTNLRLLAFHVDNYYVSETALNNVKNATKTLSTDLIIHRPFWEPTQHIYQRLLKSSGEICIACEYFVSILPLQYAAENDIPYVAYAFTPSQMKAKNMTSVLRKTNYIYYKDLITYYRELCMDLICGEFKDLLGQTWFTPSENMEKRTFPDLLFPLFYSGYDAKYVETVVSEELNWQRGSDIGGTSSNCTINKLHIYLKQKLRGKIFYEEMLKRKKDNDEVVDTVISHAMEIGCFNDYSNFLKDLNIIPNEDELIAEIKGFKKSTLLRKESNISQ